MTLNVFRIGRWLTLLLVVIWLAGCLKDFMQFEAWRWDGLLLAGMIAFSGAGVALIMLGAWAAKEVLRRHLGPKFDRRLPLFLAKAILERMRLTRWLIVKRPPDPPHSTPGE